MPVDDQQGGAPTIARQEPGWYDDPWNPANIRRWDGDEWTGETAPKPAAAPVAPAGASAAPPKPAARPRRVNPFVVGGVVAAVAVVAVVVVMSGHGSSSSSTATTAPPATTPTTAARVGLSSSVLVASDLGGGWTGVESRPLAATEFTQGPCGNAAWAHNTAGYLSSFVKGASAATAHGSVIVKVTQAPTLAVANDQQTAVESPAYGACLQQRIEAEVRSQLPPGQVLASAATTPFSVQLPVPSRAFVVSVLVSAPGGGRRVVTVNTVAMFSGTYLATVEVSWSSDAPLGGQIVQQQAAYEAAHLAALSAA
jgi:hypothetical protein